jgi:hypothetical protein
MTMNVIDAERMLSVSRELTGFAPPEAKPLTEMVRSELWARGLTTRRVLSERIISLARPLSEVKKEDVQAILDEMERTGDLTAGPRGGVAAAPLRVVKAGNGRFCLFGTLPNRFVPGVTLVGTVREISDHSDEMVASLIEQFGGMQLSVERWAGFDRVLPAGPEWLKYLDARLDSEACKQGVFDGELNGDWMVYRPSIANGGNGSNPSPWKKSSTNEEGKLWRGWSMYGWPINVWTVGGSPTDVQSMRIMSDEATRTTFALSAQTSVPIVCKADAAGTDIVVRFDSYLPMAEYRYLLTIGVMQDLGGIKRAFRIPLEIWPQVGNKLRERLGVTIEPTGM